MSWLQKGLSFFNGIPTAETIATSMRGMIQAKEGHPPVRIEFANPRGSATAANRLDIQKKTRTRGRCNPLLHLLGNWFLFFLYINRQRNVRAALERIIEKAGDVEGTASAVV